jgi:hypothetical protein
MMETYYFAWVNSEDKTVSLVTPFASSVATDSEGNFDEELAISHLYNTIPDSVNDLWVRCTDERKNYPGVSFSYDETRDAFIPPKPFDSWILNEETCRWDPPIPYPAGDHPEGIETYIWNEDIVTWEPVYEMKSDVI